MDERLRLFEQLLVELSRWAMSIAKSAHTHGGGTSGRTPARPVTRRSRSNTLPVTATGRETGC